MNQDFANCLNEIEQSIDFEFFKAFFDPVRVEILKHLAVHGEQCIKDIAENFTQDRSVISRHLELMHRNNIVAKTKHQRNIYYRLNDGLIVEKFEQTTAALKVLIGECDE